MIYDRIVIGKGLMGSAAAKYLSQSQNNVALIGPDEATALNEGIVFSSHYDQARVQRIIGKDKVWTWLNQQSAAQYETIENESEISFHHKVGCLYVNPYGSDFYLENVSEQAAHFNINYRIFENGAAINLFTSDFHFPATAKGMFENAPSGHIDPRLLIRAQTTIFQKNGGHLFNDTVCNVSAENGVFTINALSGKIYYARKVLITAGAFSNYLNLLKRKLALTIKGEITAWAKVDDKEAKRLENLPSLLYEVDEPEIQNIYLIRPLLYPDGNYYLKMGANFPDDLFFNDLKETQDWYKSPEINVNLKTMQNALENILPGISIKEWFTKKCIVTYTKHGKPYIGAVSDGLFVATGGNGYGAMCSDALGKLAATLISEAAFPEAFSTEVFEPVFADSVSKIPS